MLSPYHYDGGAHTLAGSLKGVSYLGFFNAGFTDGELGDKMKIVSPLKYD